LAAFKVYSLIMENNTTSESNTKYYKVVFESSDNCLWSSWTADSSLVVEYKLNEFVYPKLKKSKLFVFADFSEAMSYCGNMEKLRIYECEVLNPVIGRKMSNNSRLSIIIEFWNNETILTNQSNIVVNCPWKTVFCDGVKLVKKIDN